MKRQSAKPCLFLLLFAILCACQITDTEPDSNLTDDQIDTLSSLELLDDYPLYTMHYYGRYPDADYGAEDLSVPERVPAWACSLFAALGDPEQILYGRNFDWEYSPGLLLFAHPADGYDSVSMVDIAYLGFPENQAQGVTELELEERKSLLEAPLWPFDGMNEMGLAVGMAAVPPSETPHDPAKPTINARVVIREMLDHASNIDQALEILQSYNIDWDGGPPLHYLLADAAGRAVLVEFYQGEHRIIYNDQAWHQATNFLLSADGEDPEAQCHRYQTISQQMSKRAGVLDTPAALDLLQTVAQPGTQWSAVYNVSQNTVSVVIGQQYNDVHTLHLQEP